MRYFVSMPVPLEAREDLDSYLESRRVAEPTLRWTDPERWHLTLAFLPDVDDVDLDEMCERLESACAKRAPLTLGLQGGGVFGGSTSARVLWGDVAASEEDRAELDRIVVGVRNAAAASGTVVEGGRFVPHVTLARSTRPRDLRHLLDVLDLYEGPSWRVDHVDLVASHLDGTVRHEVVASHRLGPEPDEERYWWRSGIRGLCLPGDDAPPSRP